MSTLYYDFHIHSCLSPCGDNDMTPNNIAGMAKLNGLNIVALTDHNSVKNCPAFFKAAERYGITAVAGAELTTAEDIHIVCLFETLEAALGFGEAVDEKRIPIQNRPDIFGEQLILDEEDEITGEEKNLLPNATEITVEQAPALVKTFGGVCYPAHVDRESNGIIATLGDFPAEPAFDFAEFNLVKNIPEYRALYPALAEKKLLVSSDAHFLENMREAENSFELAGESDEEIRAELFGYLRSGIVP